MTAYRWTHSPSQLAWSEVGSHLALSLHSSSEPGKLSQWSCHDDNTVNIGIIIIIIIYYYNYFFIPSVV